jgi:hypothetical protein
MKIDVSKAVLYPGTTNIQSVKLFLANNKWNGKLYFKFILAINASINTYSFSGWYIFNKS